MEVQLLNAFYDTFTNGLGITICYVFILLMTIELLYVMFKYLREEKK